MDVWKIFYQSIKTKTSDGKDFYGLHLKQEVKTDPK